MKKEIGLRRYTSLPSLFHMLARGEITLLSPELWDDRNDAYFMEQFRERSELGCVLALCFSEATETYHHWRVFSGPDGVCITFRKSRLLECFNGVAGVQSRSVSYKTIKSLSTRKPSLKELPFLKRKPYRDEKEFRIIYTGDEQGLEAKGFCFALNSIERVTLNPWMPRPLFEAVELAIKSFHGCKEIKVHRTTLLENQKWKNAAIAK